jgi:hypothetical protein
MYDIYYKAEGYHQEIRSNPDAIRFCERNNIIFDQDYFDFRKANTYSGPVVWYIRPPDGNDHDEDSDDEFLSGSESETMIDNGAAAFKHEINHVDIEIPKSYRAAMESQQSSEWCQAMSEEINTMNERKVWTLIPKPPNKQILGSKWVYAIKRNAEGVIMRFKARLVAQGFNQKFGESYDEVFSPVIDFSIIRLLFTILVCLLCWTHRQYDVKCAYLYAKLHNDVYMRQPKGFEIKGQEDWVCQLDRAIYGLHQSGREWNFELDSTLQRLGFVPFSWCNCIYRFGNNTILVVYVDDIVIFGKNSTFIDKAASLIKSVYTLTDLGETRKLLGVEFIVEHGNLFIHQSGLINKMLKQFGKYCRKITSLPLSPTTILTRMDCPEDEDQKREVGLLPYRSLLGSLAFLASRTRPDLSYAVNVLSQFQSNPGIVHWEILVKILEYVKSTSGIRLKLNRKTSDFQLTTYSDASFASNRDDRTSIGGTLITFNSVPIAWRTFKQKCVSLSSMEAEYIALSESVKDSLFYDRVITELVQFVKFKYSSIVLCDNISAIDFSKSAIEKRRTKHVDIKFHFIRKLVLDNVVTLDYVNTKANLADYFTKAFNTSELKRVNSILFDLS